MTILPVVQRELLVAAKRRRLYIVRTSVAAVGMVIVIFALIDRITDRWGGSSTLAGFGGQVFMPLAVLLNLFALLGGVTATADAISSEKREGTLGLLFLTPLSGVDVVLGKIAANSINILYGIVAAVPVLALTMLFGGVSSGQVVAVGLTTLNNLFLAVAVGIASSSLCLLERNAVSLAVATLLILCFAGPLGSIKLDSLQVFSPGTALLLAGQHPFGKMHLVSLGSMHALAWVALAFACWRTPRFWQQNPRMLGERIRDAWDRIRFGPPEYKERRRTFLEQDPVGWLATRDRSERLQFWAVMAVVAALWIAGWIKFGRSWTISAIGAALIFHMVLKVWCANAAIRPWHEGRRNSTLTMLMATPLAGAPLISAHLGVLLRAVRLPLAVLILVDVFMTMLVLRMPGEFEFKHVFIVAVAMVIVLVLDVYALIWMGMWQGLRRSSYQRASMFTLGTVHLPRWICSYTFMFFWHSEEGLFFIAVLLAIVFDLAIMGHAQTQIHEQLRRILCDDPDPLPVAVAQAAAPVSQPK